MIGYRLMHADQVHSSDCGDHTAVTAVQVNCVNCCCNCFRNLPARLPPAAHVMPVVRRCQICSRDNNEASSRRYSLARAKCRTDHSIMSKRARATRQQLGFESNAEDVHLLSMSHGSGLAATAAAAASDPTGSAALLADAQGPANDSDFSAQQDDTDGNNSSTDDEEVQPRRKKAAKGSNSAADGSKQRKGQQGKRKPQQEKKGRRIGAKKAKKVYCLDDSDLDKMQDTKIVANMFFGGECYILRQGSTTTQQLLPS